MRSYTKEAFSLSGANRFILCILLVFVACTKTNKLNEVEAEKAFRRYIDLRFSNQSQTKQELLEYTTGIHRTALEQLTEEEFRVFNNLQNIKKNTFKVLSVHCASLICSLRYNLAYTTSKDQTETFSSQVEKAVELRLDNGHWKIAEISDLSTQHVGLAPLTSHHK
jgi:hypothetical protein